MNFNQQDHQIYDNIFKNPPVDWKAVPLTPVFDDCVKFLRSHDVKSVLDIGCGPGVWANHLGKNGFKVRGFDFSEAAVVYANTWAKETGFDLEFRVATVTHNPFTETFDAAIATQILENVSKAECAKAIEVIHQSIKNGGVVFAMFNPFMSRERIQEVKESNNPTKDCTLVNYSDEELKSLFRDGFTLLDFQVCEGDARVLTLRRI